MEEIQEIRVEAMKIAVSMRSAEEGWADVYGLAEEVVVWITTGEYPDKPKD